MLELNPRPDGTILARIPEGDWYVSVSSGLPAGYSIKALTYGTADILKSPLKVRLSENAAIRLVVTNSAPRLSKVYGRITGLTPARIAMGSMQVTLSGPLNWSGPIPAINTQQRAAAVRADGTPPYSRGAQPLGCA